MPLLPRLVWSKFWFDSVKEEIPQLSDDPLSIWDAVIVAVPELLRATVMFLHDTVGLILSITVTVAADESLFPEASCAIK